MMRNILGLVLLVLSTATARAEIGLSLEVYGPYGSFAYSDTSSGTLGGHAGYNDASGGVIAPDFLQPGVYAGDTRCRTPGFPCGISDAFAYGDVSASSGRIRASVGVQTPSFGLYAASLGASLSDSVTIAQTSEGIGIKLKLEATHTVDVDLPESSFPGTDFQYMLTMKRPDAAAPVGCGPGEGAEPCEKIFGLFHYVAGHDTVSGQTSWAWSYSHGGFPTGGESSDSGTGSTTSVDLYFPNPMQTFDMIVNASFTADCVRQAGGNCQASVNAFNSAYIELDGDYVSANGYRYTGQAAVVPEPST